jgi:hypothetical protein
MPYLCTGFKNYLKKKLFEKVKIEKVKIIKLLLS